MVKDAPEGAQYLVIADAIAAQIAADGPPSTRLPSERALAERFGCQRPTIREALQYLEGRGLIYRKDRSGWYVSPPRLDYDLNLAVPLAEIARLQDRELVTEVLEENPALQPPCREPATRFLALRRRSLDGQTVLIERLYMPDEYGQELAGADLTMSMSDLLRDELGVQITYERLTLNPTGMDPGLARLFSATAGTPVLEIERVRFSGDRLVSVDVEYWRPAAVRVTMNTHWERV